MPEAVPFFDVEILKIVDEILFEHFSELCVIFMENQSMSICDTIEMSITLPFR